MTNPVGIPNINIKPILLKTLLKERIKFAWKDFCINLKDIEYKPFIKWVWWKRQLLTQFKELYPQNFKNYIEPFLWGGAVFFDLKNQWKIQHSAILSDINEELVNTYEVVKTDVENLIKRLEVFKYKHSKEFFLYIRSWDKRPDFKLIPNYIRAARFIYLNRTCFNWMYRVNSKWFFNVPFWKYDNPKICDEEWLRIAEYALENTKILCQSFIDIVNYAEKWDFVYFDPPYDILSNTANFTDYIQWGFWRDKQKELAEIFKKLNEKWCYVMLSNHNTPFIQDLYKDFRQEVVSAKRMINSDASKRWTIEEIVVLNY